MEWIALKNEFMIFLEIFSYEAWVDINLFVSSAPEDISDSLLAL